MKVARLSTNCLEGQPVRHQSQLRLGLMAENTNPNSRAFSKQGLFLFFRDDVGVVIPGLTRGHVCGSPILQLCHIE